ncbi:MAG: M20/M25/M40 family metallo-hydrolase, partial [Verrucomicrobiae bacterium]|nr:M20/M25/M40 family metallo-hydrolase [Verrucomicrobiae bacterium]
MRCAMMAVLCGIALGALGVARGQEWQSLFDGNTLTGWTTAPFGGSGEVAVADGAIVLNMGMLTGVNYTNTVPTMDYEVEVLAKRAVGSDFFCGLTFPVGPDFATLIVGGWGGSVVGISSLDDNDAAHNETTTYQRFEAGRWYKIRLAVTPTHLSVWIDENRRIHANIEGKKISLRPGDIELSKPFGFASYGTTAELKDIRLRSLKPAAGGGGGGGEKKAGAQLPAEVTARLDRLVAAATNSPVPHRRLAQLCDTFGPRYAGSTNLEAAIDWVLEELRRDGLENVRGEPVTVRRWRRGMESAFLVAPHAEPLPVLALGGTVATPPEGVTAPVLVVSSFAELSNRVAEARGRIVVFNAPFTDYGNTVRFRWAGAIEAAKVGAVASLIRSVTPFSLRTPHTGGMSYQDNVPRIPHAALAPEDAERLARWQAAGVTPVVRLVLGAETLPDSPSRNVVAELRGRERPDDVVVVGGHFDSWDVGQGAQDDAGGCLAAWETLRLLRELDLRPRCTVRLVLWTDEENHGAG